MKRLKILAEVLEIIRNSDKRFEKLTIKNLLEFMKRKEVKRWRD